MICEDAFYTASANEKANSCSSVTSFVRNSASVITIFIDDILANKTEKSKCGIWGVDRGCNHAMNNGLAQPFVLESDSWCLVRCLVPPLITAGVGQSVPAVILNGAVRVSWICRS